MQVVAVAAAVAIGAMPLAAVASASKFLSDAGVPAPSVSALPLHVVVGLLPLPCAIDFLLFVALPPLLHGPILQLPLPSNKRNNMNSLFL